MSKPKTTTTKSKRPRKKMGRPIDPNARRERILIRANDEELARWEAAAAAAGHRLGTWLWLVANKAAEAK